MWTKCNDFISDLTSFLLLNIFNLINVKMFYIGISCNPEVGYNKMCRSISEYDGGITWHRYPHYWAFLGKFAGHEFFFVHTSLLTRKETVEFEQTVEFLVIRNVMARMSWQQGSTPNLPASPKTNYDNIIQKF